MKTYASITDALNDLRKRGYDADFGIQSFCLYCGDLDMRLNEGESGEFNVDEVYRFKGDSSPDDNAAVYAISATTGVKGTIVYKQGTFEGNIDSEIAKKLHNHPAIAG